MGKGDGKGDGAGDGKGGGAGVGKGLGQGEGSGAYKGKTDRIAVPAMPMPMAVVCCVLNFILPGFGTILAGFSNFCCSRNEDIDNSARFVSCLINWGIGCAQLITAVVCIFGLCWSWMWGIYFIGMSAEYYHNNRVEDTDRPGQAIMHQPQSVVITNTVGYSNQPVSHVVMINQPHGPRFGGKVVQIGGQATVFQTGSQPAPIAPPAYSGPPGQPTEAQLYPMDDPPPYPGGSAYPGTSDPAYPDKNKQQM